MSEETVLPQRFYLMWKEQEHCVIKRKFSYPSLQQTKHKHLQANDWTLFPFQRYFTRATDEAPRDTSQLSFLHRHILAFEGYAEDQ